MSARRPLRLAVGPADPHHAASLYAAAFQLAAPEAVPAGWRLHLGRATLLVTAERPVASTGYAPGRTPRLELRVDDVAAWVAQLTAAGFTERARLPGYAQLLDPHGHLWALAQAS